MEALQKEIKEFQPVLQQNQLDNEILLEKLNVNSIEAKETEIFVIKETESAQVKRNEVNEMKQEC